MCSTLDQTPHKKVQSWNGCNFKTFLWGKFAPLLIKIQYKKNLCEKIAAMQSVQYPKFSAAIGWTLHKTWVMLS